MEKSVTEKRILKKYQLTEKKEKLNFASFVLYSVQKFFKLWDKKNLKGSLQFTNYDSVYFKKCCGYGNGKKKKQLIGAEILLETIKTSLWILDSKS